MFLYKATFLLTIIQKKAGNILTSQSIHTQLAKLYIHHFIVIIAFINNLLVFMTRANQYLIT